MSVIFVCPAGRAAAFAREHRPSHVLGLASPAGAPFQKLAANSPRRHAEEPRSGVSKHARRDPVRASRRGLRQLLSMTPLGGPDGPEEAGVGFVRPGHRSVPAEHRLALVFHDIAWPRTGFVAPTAGDVDAILAFGRSWTGDRPLLVHCALGISRSTAAALVLACERWPETSEFDLARGLREAAPCATPNPLVVALADTALRRNGRLIAAVAAIGRGAEYVPQAGFALTLGY